MTIQSNKIENVCSDDVALSFYVIFVFLRIFIFFYGFSLFLLSFPHQYVFPLFVQFSLLGRMRDKVSVEICLMTDRACALLFTKITKPAKILFTKNIKKPAKILFTKITKPAKILFTEIIKKPAKISFTKMPAKNGLLSLIMTVSQWVSNVFRFWRQLSHLTSLRVC